MIDEENESEFALAMKSHAMAMVRLLPRRSP